MLAKMELRLLRVVKWVDFYNWKISIVNWIS